MSELEEVDRLRNEIVGLQNEVEDLQDQLELVSTHLGKEESAAGILAEDQEFLQGQIDTLAEMIMAEVPGEPSRSEGACECAMRVMRGLAEENKRLQNKPGADFKRKLILAVMGLYGDQPLAFLRKSETRGIVYRIEDSDVTWLRELVEGALRVQREADAMELDRNAQLQKSNIHGLDTPYEKRMDEIYLGIASELERVAGMLTNTHAHNHERILRARLDKRL